MKLRNILFALTLFFTITSLSYAANEPYVFRGLTFNSAVTPMPKNPDNSGGYYWVKDANDTTTMQCRQYPDGSEDYPKGYGSCELADTKFGDRTASKATAEFYNDKLMKVTIEQEGYPKIYFNDHYNSNAFVDSLEIAFGEKFGKDLVKAPFKVDTKKSEYSSDYITLKNKKFPKHKFKEIFVSKNDLIVRIHRYFTPRTEANLTFELIDKSLMSDYEKALRIHKQALNSKKMNQEKQQLQKATKDF